MIDLLKMHFPKSKMLFLGLLPQNTKTASARINDVNNMLASKYGFDNKNLLFVDLASKYASMQNKTKIVPSLMSSLFPSPEGLRVLMDVLSPHLQKLKKLNRPLPPLTKLHSVQPNHVRRNHSIIGEYKHANFNRNATRSQRLRKNVTSGEAHIDLKRDPKSSKNALYIQRVFFTHKYFNPEFIQLEKLSAGAKHNRI